MRFTRALAMTLCAVLPAPEILGAESAVLETVMVTAQKRAQDAQDVGIAISAFSSEQVQALGFESSLDVARMTPGVHLGGSIAGQTSMFTIRGVTQNDFTDSVEAPVAVYIDEGYIAMGQGQVFGLFDIERVEIAKGPQSTLFGRNATGGVVHYITNKPQREFGGYADAAYGSYNHTRFEAAITGPLGDVVSARLSGLYNAFDEILENKYPLAAENPSAGSPGGGEDMWNDDSWAVRGQLLIEPSDEFDILLSAFSGESNLSSGPYQASPTVAVLDAGGRHVNTIAASPTQLCEAVLLSGACTPLSYVDGEGAGAFFPEDNVRDFNGVPTPGGDLFGYRDPDGADFDTSGDFAYTDLNETETSGAQLRLTWDLSDATTLTAITDYKSFDKMVIMDVDAGPIPQSVFQSQAETESLTQELRINAALERSRVTGGYYFLSIDNETLNGLGVPLGSPLHGGPGVAFAGVDANNTIALETTSHALFGQMEYDLTERWMLTAGARVVREEKDYALASPVYANFPPFGADTQVDSALELFRLPISAELDMAYSDESSDTLWAGKLQLDYSPNDDVLLYFGVNRGVKAGSYNAQLQDGSPRLPRAQIRYDEEVLTNYEGGFKSEWLGGRLRVNGALYFYDYQDYQAFKFTQSSGTVSNADADTVGVELDITANPIDGLDLLLSVAKFDSTVKDLEIAPGLRGDVDPSYAPELQIAGLARYAWSALGGEIALQGDFNYSSEFFYNIRNFDTHEYDDYIVGNVRLLWDSAASGWSASLFVENVTDERYGVMGFDLSTLCGCSEDYYGKPRWYGASVRYEF